MRPHSLLAPALLTLASAAFGTACSDESGDSSAGDGDSGGNSGDGDGDTGGSSAGDGDGDDDSGGGSGDGDGDAGGGSGGNSAGDGDGDGDTWAEGSAHYVIDYPEASVGVCGVTSVGGIGDSVGNVPELPLEGGSPTFFGRPIADGETYNSDGAAYQIECRVSGTSSHSIEIFMRGPNHSPLADTATGDTSIEISGDIAADGTGSGTVTYRTTTSGPGTNPAEIPCTLSAVPHPQGGFYQIGDGQVHLTFNCPETIPTRDDFSRCEARGTIGMTGCSQPTQPTLMRSEKFRCRVVSLCLLPARAQVESLLERLSPESDAGPHLPVDVILGEAIDIAELIETHLQEQKFKSKTMPGLMAFFSTTGLTENTATELRELQATASTVGSRYSNLMDANEGTTLEDAQALIRDLRLKLSFALEDGEHPTGAAQLARLRDKEAEENSQDGVALVLDNYRELAREHLAELSKIPDFDPAIVEEAVQTAQGLRQRSADALTGNTGREQQRLLALRNRLLAAITERLRESRRVIRYVFRDYPEIVQKATSNYTRDSKRRRRAADEAAGETASAVDPLEDTQVPAGSVG